MMKFSNVWDALFDDPGEKAVLEIKSGLMDEIRHYLKQENLTQEKAAEVLGVSQPRISDISTGKISKFTIEDLLILYNCAVRIDIDEESDRRIEEYFALIPVKTKMIFKNKKIGGEVDMQ